MPGLRDVSNFFAVKAELFFKLLELSRGYVPDTMLFFVDSQPGPSYKYGSYNVKKFIVNEMFATKLVGSGFSGRTSK